MEKYGAPGRIHLSAATRDLLGDRFCFEARGGLEIKGKGVMETFFLEANQKPRTGLSGVSNVIVRPL
jgi:class 3 adenylate cyclase